jgi:hypothetical protein
VGRAGVVMPVADSITTRCMAHFQLVNGAANTSVVTGWANAQDDLRPATPASSTSGSVFGNDRIFCCNVKIDIFISMIYRAGSGRRFIREMFRSGYSRLAMIRSGWELQVGPGVFPCAVAITNSIHSWLSFS